VRGEGGRGILSGPSSSDDFGGMTTFGGTTTRRRTGKTTDTIEEQKNNSRVRRIHAILLELVQTKDVILEVLGVLAIDRVQFPPGGAFRE
jgi:hypothetical protein